MALNKKYVYSFGGKKAAGRGSMKELLGGKGAGLAEMTRLSIPVPPGFTITTEVCSEFFKNGQKLPRGLWEEAIAAMKQVEKLQRKRFGDPSNPLLVSVRSGSRASMPGMMDTILNLGLNNRSVKGLIAHSGNERFGWDAYRRFVAMFGSVVMGVKREDFEAALGEKKKACGVSLDTELPVAALQEMVQIFEKIILSETGKPFPDDPYEQLRLAIHAVFNSWNGQRAITYRRINGIPDSWGTAVNVVAMVFGNMGDDSGTGVAFTRNPSSGKRQFFGEFLFNAQGEDVVAGIRTPLPIAALAQRLPAVYKELLSVYKRLETHYRDMLDLEFTVQQGKLYMLQTRVGKRTAQAAIQIAVDMVKEKQITREEALLRVNPIQIDQLLHPTIDPAAQVEVIAKGLPASPGAAIGKVVFSAEDAERMAELGEKVILVRMETTPEDIGGMHVAQGVLTARGGMTSHAAVVARGMGKCCITGCDAVIVDLEHRLFTVGSHIVKEGSLVTLNGSTGEVILGETLLVQPDISPVFKVFMGWADQIRTLKVRTNADTPKDAATARRFGAEGIGLCRTEHMFFEEKRIRVFREMILADSKEVRREVLSRLLPIQRGDFLEIFKEMTGLPITIRLLDPPLHEFLPHTEEELSSLSRETGVPIARLREKRTFLHEINPMLGHRGCRLGVTYPEIYEMQVQAIFEAACEFTKNKRKKSPIVKIEVMIPLVAHLNEFVKMKALCMQMAEAVMKRYKQKVPYLIGTMLELPRAVLVADQIAQEAEFFSFGTNDLTQMTFGLSRDDSGRFLPQYLDEGVLSSDPFVTIDQEGVGTLMRMGVEKGRGVRADLKIGICGEHGGEPTSVEFCHRIGLNYVSCSPYRVPIARLAAAQAVVRGRIR